VSIKSSAAAPAAHRVPDFQALMVYRYALRPSPRFEYVSPAALRITGCSPEDFYKDPDVPLASVHPDDRAAAERMRVDPRSDAAPVVLRWCHPGGRIVWAEHLNRPVFDRDGSVIAVEGIGRDITESLATRPRMQPSEDQLRRLAGRLQAQREADRVLVARELHDDVGQIFTSLKLELAQTAKALLEHAIPLPVIDQLQALMGIVDIGSERVRRLATQLRPAELDHLGLGAALEFEAAAIRRRTGLRVRISGAETSSGLQPDQETAVFRIVQEALTNTIRHASASAVVIRMFQRGHDFIVRVIDNGRGIRSDQATAVDAFGLLGMRERAQLIGARLAITGQSGRGTKVSLIIPVHGGDSRG
jgi:two-component system sensor histidine kinase UhpB